MNELGIKVMIRERRFRLQQAEAKKRTFLCQLLLCNQTIKQLERELHHLAELPAKLEEQKMKTLNEEYIDFVDVQSARKAPFYSFEDWKMQYKGVE